MFWNSQSKEDQEDYADMLQILGSLSGLFSDNAQPYLNYRSVENLFCRSFLADNLSRSDVSVDASKNGIGIGIKTFTNRNNNNLEKIAEFNRQYKNIADGDVRDRIRMIAELRNERVSATKRIHGLESVLYHCVVRAKGEIFLHEQSMDLIDLSNIGSIEEKSTTIRFDDGLNEYSFNSSKSTLYQRFRTADPIDRISVDIIADPFSALKAYLSGQSLDVRIGSEKLPFVVLPLYSVRNKNEKYVAEGSGLNQWNAGGRKRDTDEAYIQIPSWIHAKFPDFFPARDQEFSLKLPDGRVLSAKVCQDNSKALMTNPNKALGEWLLRDVLDLKAGELLTYSKLLNIGLDSIIVHKIGANEYMIDFRETGTYQRFEARKNK